MPTTIIVVNRSRTSAQRVDRVDYICASSREWQGKAYASISFYTNKSANELKRYGQGCWKEVEVIEVKSVRSAVKLLKEKHPLLTADRMKSRVRYNRTAIQTMMKRLELQERLFESMV